MLKNSLGRLIRKKRESLGMTRAVLAKEIGVSTTAIQNWECGKDHPKYSNIKEISRVLGLDYEMLSKGRTVYLGEKRYLKRTKPNLIDLEKDDSIFVIARAVWELVGNQRTKEEKNQLIQYLYFIYLKKENAGKLNDDTLKYLIESTLATEMLFDANDIVLDIGDIFNLVTWARRIDLDKML